MQEQEVKKIKTLLDFEETDEPFEVVANKCEEACESEYNDEDGIDLKIKIEFKDDKENEKAILNTFTYEDWTDEQFNEFAAMVYDTSEEICHTLIGKNIAYNNAYWWVRKACEQKYGDAGIPYFVHIFEKSMREKGGDNREDARLDKLGYNFLEYVCQKLDEKWAKDDTENELLMQMDGAVSDFGETPEPSSELMKQIASLMDEKKKLKAEEKSDLIEKIPVKKPGTRKNPHPGYCVFCGKKLTGQQRLFCSHPCENADYRRRYTKIKECVICGDKFETSVAVDAKTCSSICAFELRMKTYNENHKQAAVCMKNIDEEQQSCSESRRFDNLLNEDVLNVGTAGGVPPCNKDGE